MDQNWYEGRLGMKKGIFPVAYVNVLQEPGEYCYGTKTSCAVVINKSPRGVRGS